MLGPMVNPAFVKKQLTGVFSLELARLYGYLYQRTETDFIILHSLDGYDEISLTSPAKIISNEGEMILYPPSIGFDNVSKESLRGGTDVESSSRLFLNILEGKGTQAQQNVVIANAGMAIHCADKNRSIPDAVNLATETLESGKALATFKKFIELNKN